MLRLQGDRDCIVHGMWRRRRPARDYLEARIALNCNSCVSVLLAACKHWACNLSDSTCVGCGVRICPQCLKEPEFCRCENKDECCE